MVESWPTSSSAIRQNFIIFMYIQVLIDAKMEEGFFLHGKIAIHKQI